MSTKRSCIAIDTGLTGNSRFADIEGHDARRAKVLEQRSPWPVFLRGSARLPPFGVT